MEEKKNSRRRRCDQISLGKNLPFYSVTLAEQHDDTTERKTKKKKHLFHSIHLPVCRLFCCSRTIISSGE